MLFSSYTFVFAFLPMALAGFAVARGAGGARAAMAWLLGASLLFYGYSSPTHLLLLLGSIVLNYGMGQRLVSQTGGARRIALAMGIAVNLAILGYFKYANFLGDVAEQLTGYHWFVRVALPLGVSFFTFQQIAYLVDSYRGRCRAHGLLDYALFVSFFPQLIAGPIVHHCQVLPQIQRGRLGLRPRAFATGISFFTLGLAKKVLVADQRRFRYEPPGAGTDAPLHP